jgi:hypothetical protein
MKPHSEVSLSALIPMRFEKTDITNEGRSLSSCKTPIGYCLHDGRMSGQRVQCIDACSQYV